MENTNLKINYTPIITNTINLNDTICMHNSCTRCYGKGVDREGRPCIHYISCNCSKCHPKTY